MRQSKIADELETLIRARYPLIYVVTWEEPRLDAILSSIAVKRGKKLFVWSISRGLLPFGTPLQSKKIDEATRDPAVALDRVVEHVEPAIFCFKDFHPFMNDPVIVRKLRELAQYLKSTYTTVVLSSPTQRIPMELEKDIAVVEFGLPDEAELRELLERTIEEVSRNTPIKIQLTEDEKERIVQAALGLTLSEAENVFAKTLIKRGGLSAEHLDVIISEKEQIVRKSGLLEYYHSTERFDDVGGLDLLKDWLRKRQMAFTERAREYGLPTPKGVLLIGVQGCGKSLTAKAVASLWKVPLLRLDMSRIFSSLVGASEENLRNALRVAESVSPCILWVDELEKSFAGAQSSALSDAGTTARVLGYFLTWLQEKTAPCFVIATANSIEQLPPELLRKGRLDEIFFVDLPSKRERMEIFAIHLRKRRRDPSLFDLEALAEASQRNLRSEVSPSSKRKLTRTKSSEFASEDQHDGLNFGQGRDGQMGRFERLEFDAGIPRKERKEPPPIYDDNYYANEGDRCFYRADYEGALLNYSRALRFNNDCEKAWVGQVKALIELGELEEAVIWCDRGLQRFKNSPSLLACKGRIIARQGDVQRGMAYVDAALQEKGSDLPIVWLARADVLLTRKSPMARFCLEKAHELAPQSWQVSLEAAMICLQQNEPLFALKYAQQAVELNRDHPFVWCILGDAYRDSGQRQDAERCYRYALTIEHNFAPAILRLKGLQSKGFWGWLKSLFGK